MHKKAATSDEIHYDHETPANALKSRMCAEDRTAPIMASVRKIDSRSRKLIWCCLEVVNNLLKRYATDQAIVEYDAAILRYVQPAHRSPHQYADDQVDLRRTGVET